MTDREKLIELLDVATKEFRFDAWENTDKIADFLISNGATFQKWIPVSERLPEPETDVLTFSGGCIDIITYRYNRRGLACFMFRDDCGYWKETFGKITHWMPLPEPPKEGNCDG